MLETQSLKATDWSVVIPKSRVDSFNHKLFTEKIRELADAGCTYIAIDLQSNRFFSLAAIQFVVHTANTLRARGGQLALISPPEKTKRHFEIYGSLDNIRIFRKDIDGVIGKKYELA